MKLFNDLKSKLFVGTAVSAIALTSLFLSFHAFAEEIPSDGPVVLKIKMRSSTDVGMWGADLAESLRNTSIDTDNSNLKMTVTYTGENNVFDILIRSKSEIRREFNCGVIQFKTMIQERNPIYNQHADSVCIKFREYLSILNSNNEGLFFSPDKCIAKGSEDFELTTKLYILPEGEKSCTPDPNTLIPANGQPQTATGTAQVQDDSTVKIDSSKASEEKKSDAEAQEQKVK